MSGARITDAFTLGRMTHRDTPPSERPIPPPSLLLPAWCSHLGLDYVECMGGDPEARNAKSQVALRGRRAWEGCVSFAFFRVSWNSSSSSLPLGSVLPEGRACVVDATLPLVRWSNPPPPGQLAVITQGIAARVAQGNASSAKAAQQSKIMPIMGNLATNHIRDYADVGVQTKL